MTKMINDLSFERVRDLFDYDAENGWPVRKKDQFGRIVNRPCGNKPVCKGYGQVRIDGKTYQTHRIVWLLVHGEWPDGEIDHKDRNPMNNRIENLRVASSSENSHNHGLQRNNSSGYPGVSFHKPSKKYQAYIKVDNKIIYLGLFNTAEEAYRAYQLAKIKYHPTSPAAQQYLLELTYAA